MSLINDMLKDLEQRNFQFTGDNGAAECGSIQKDMNLDSRIATGCKSKRYIGVTITILLAGFALCGTVLFQSAQVANQSNLETANVPKSKQSIVSVDSSLDVDLNTNKNSAQTKKESLLLSSRNSGVGHRLEAPELTSSQLPSSANSAARFRSAVAINQFRLKTANIPKTIRTEASIDSSLNTVRATKEKKAPKTTEPILLSSQSSYQEQGATQDNVAAAKSQPSVNSMETSYPSYIEVIHRPLSTKQQLLSDFLVAANFYKEGNYTEAERLLEDLLARDGSQHKARLLLAKLYAKQELDSSAELVLYNGLLNYPQHVPYVNLYAQMLAEQGRDNAAIDTLQNALPGSRDNADFHALLAGLYQRTGNSAAAIKSYMSALRLKPTHGEWWMGLGISSEQAGDEATAQNAYSEALLYPLASEVEQYTEQRLQQLAAKKAASKN